MALHLFSAHYADHGLGAVAALTDRLNDVDARVRAEPAVAGLVTVATCNRVELYLDSDLPEADLRRLIGAAASPVSAAHPLTYRRDAAAIQHLFRVTAGLDSMVVGDREVASQVRRGIRAARRHQVSSRTLSLVSEQALRTARQVRRRTHLGSRGRSVVAVALDLVDREWSTTAVTVLGTGAYAGAVVAELAARGCPVVKVHSASGRADAFAAGRLGVVPVAGSVADACQDADVVISCRGAGRVEIDASLAADLVAARAGDLTLIDLAVGHDVDPACADLDRVGLLDLETVGRHAPETSRLDLARAEQIVSDGVTHTLDVVRGRSMDPAVIALRAAIADMVSAEQARLPVGRDLSHAEASHALRRLAARLAHGPSVRARQAGAEGRSQEFLAALAELWGPEVVDGVLDEAPSADRATGTDA